MLKNNFTDVKPDIRLRNVDIIDKTNAINFFRNLREEPLQLGRDWSSLLPDCESPLKLQEVGGGIDTMSNPPLGELCIPIISSSSISSSSSGTSSSSPRGPKSLMLWSSSSISKIWSTIFSVWLRSLERRELSPRLGTVPDRMAATFRLVSHFRSDHFLMTSMTSRWHSPISLTRAVISAQMRFFASVGTPRLNLPLEKKIHFQNWVSNYIL